MWNIAIVINSLAGVCSNQWAAHAVINCISHECIRDCQLLTSIGEQSIAIAIAGAPTATPVTKTGSWPLLPGDVTIVVEVRPISVVNMTIITLATAGRLSWSPSYCWLWLWCCCFHSGCSSPPLSVLSAVPACHWHCHFELEVEAWQACRSSRHLGPNSHLPKYTLENQHLMWPDIATPIGVIPGTDGNCNEL